MKSVTFQLDGHNYESLRTLAFNERDTISNLLRQGAELILEKHAKGDVNNKNNVDCELVGSKK